MKHVRFALFVSISGLAFISCSLFTNTVEAPTVDVESGTYDEAQSVTLTTTTAGATIKYTTDDSNPITSTTFGIGKVGSATASVTVSRSLTIKAYAYMSGMVDSEVVTATYVITTTADVGPDYAVSSPVYPTNVVPSGGFQGNFRVSNTSVAGASDISWAVYISSDGNFDAGDTQVDSGTQSSLGVGGVSGAISFAGTWPGNPTGYYLIIIISADDELITGDNVTVSSLIPLAVTGRFVAVGDGGHVTYSDDGGATWTVSTDTDLDVNNLTGIALDTDSGRLVAVGASDLGNGVAFYSDDGGETWTQSIVPVTEPLTEAAWGNDTTLGARFVAVGTSRILYSTDPSVSWTVASVTGRPFTDTAFGADIFVAGTSQNNVTEYSTDGGAAWTTTSSGIQVNSQILSITFAGTRFVAAGNNTVSERFFFTADGITWTSVNPGSVIAGSMRAVAFDGSLNVVAVGDNSRIWISSNEGGTWGVASGAVLPDSELKGVAFGDTVWVSVGTAVTANVWRTTNLAGDWEAVAESATTLRDIIYIP
jgi:hypothetical protein